MHILTLSQTEGVANMIDRDKILTRDDFYALGKNDRRELLGHWRMIHTTEQIKKGLGLSTTAFYSLLKRLDLPTNLNEFKDEQPSILKEIKEPKQEEEPTFNVEVTGSIRHSDIPKLLEIARNNNVEVKMK